MFMLYDVQNNLDICCVAVMYSGEQDACVDIHSE